MPPASKALCRPRPAQGRRDPLLVRGQLPPWWHLPGTLSQTGQRRQLACVAAAPSACRAGGTSVLGLGAGGAWEPGAWCCGVFKPWAAVCQGGRFREAGSGTRLA